MYGLKYILDRSPLKTPQAKYLVDMLTTSLMAIAALTSSATPKKCPNCKSDLRLIKKGDNLWGCSKCEFETYDNQKHVEDTKNQNEFDRLLRFHEKIESMFELAFGVERAFFDERRNGCHNCDAETKKPEIVRCLECQAPVTFSDSIVEGHRRATCENCGQTFLVRVPESEA